MRGRDLGAAGARWPYNIVVNGMPRCLGCREGSRSSCGLVASAKSLLISWRDGLAVAVGLWLISGSGYALTGTGTSEAAATSGSAVDAAAVTDTSDVLAVSDGSQDELAVGVVESAGSGGLVVESYARDYSVSVDEAGRRLGRIALLQEVMGSIRVFEGCWLGD